MQVELGNTADLSCLELSRLWLEAILSYLDLSGERRGERGERGAKSVERGAWSGRMLKPKRFMGCIWKGKVQLVGTGENYWELPGCQI